VLLGLLTLTIGRLSAEPAACCAVPSRTAAVAGEPIGSKPAATDPTSTDDPLGNDQIARLGAELFGRHLLAVEVAGLLLLVALIGAVAVVSRGEAALEADRGLLSERARG
jgi:NADH:ubiquinone oxidoreductase subunit 6 (subunit J)